MPREYIQRYKRPLRSRLGCGASRTSFQTTRTWHRPGRDRVGPPQSRCCAMARCCTRHPHSLHPATGNLCGISRTYRCTNWPVDRILRSLEILDDTLIVLLSDNGASNEGGPTGAFNLRKHMVYEPESPAVGLARLDDIGGAQSFTHYPTGWAQVSNTPLKWYKRDTHGGGIRAPLIVHWPRGISSRGAIRTQFHHVIDIAPTLYEILEVEVPTQYCGTAQMPLHGISLAYTFESDSPTRKEVQHFELIGDRAIWQRGWKAVTQHPKGADFDADQWELYHLDLDFAELNDLAAEQPERLRKLVELWWSEAGKYGVLPSPTIATGSERRNASR